MTTLGLLIPLLEKEMAFAFEKHGAYHNAHEQYAVMLEEVEEWWDAIKGNIDDSCQYELLQIAAVALRYIIERGDADSIAWVQDKRHVL